MNRRLLDALAVAVDRQTAALGDGCERAAAWLDDLSELLRWLAAVTRATP